MFQRFNIFGRKRQRSESSAVNELMLTLNMPGWAKGKTVPARRVVTALLWQHYGLDPLHPVVSRWLERNAPDVKYAVAENRFADGDERDNDEFRVTPNGTIEVYLALEVDDRLREVSSQYVLKQLQYSIEPEKKPTRMLSRLLKTRRVNKSPDRHLAYQC